MTFWNKIILTISGSISHHTLFEIAAHFQSAYFIFEISIISIVLLSLPNYQCTIKCTAQCRPKNHFEVLKIIYNKLKQILKIQKWFSFFKT